MKQIKVLQLIDSLNTGGAEMMAVNIANGLSEFGVESHLCVTRKEGHLKNKLNSTVKYLYLHKKSTIDIRAITELKKYIEFNSISIIHAHSSSFFLARIIKLLKTSIKICWHDHYGYSEDIANRKFFILKQFSTHFCHIFSVNKKLENWAEINLKAKGVSFLPNFASLTKDKFTFLEGVDGKRIICLANLRPQKDHLNLIEAFKSFQKSVKGWTLHLVGEDKKNDYSKSIKQRIQDYNLSDSIFIYGSKPDISFILSQGTIGVLSSISEGLPISLLEYGQANLPVVCTDVGACSSVIKHDYSGYIVSPNNNADLALYLIKLAKSKENRFKFGVNLNRDIKLQYSKETIIRTIIKVYKNCLQAPNT
jgi:glycosyltransferase involved in cell wall biosynthesis